MPATGLEVFDKTLQATNIWLDEIVDRAGPDRRFAWHVLGTVLHVLRDRMQPDLSAHFAAQLPLLVRGLYYEGFRPSAQPSHLGSADDLLEALARGLENTRTVSPALAFRTVIEVLERHVSHGQMDKIRRSLPASVAALWPQTAQ